MMCFICLTLQYLSRFNFKTVKMPFYSVTSLRGMLMREIANGRRLDFACQESAEAAGSIGFLGCRSALMFFLLRFLDFNICFRCSSFFFSFSGFRGDDIISMINNGN